MYRFFMEECNKDGEFLRISGSDFNHIANVLRLRTGEEIIISNGQGIDNYCIIVDINDTEVLCKVLYETASEQELSRKIYLFQGLPKHDKMELIIQKSIELGVYEIIPVQMSRSITKLDDKNRAKKIERWQKIAEAAAKQSHRSIVPKVHDCLSMKDAISYASELGLILVPYEKAALETEGHPFTSLLNSHKLIGIFIGPEGGFEESEVNALKAIGAHEVSLGRRILRTETASLVILSIIMYHLEVENYGSAGSDC